MRPTVEITVGDAKPESPRLTDLHIRFQDRIKHEKLDEVFGALLAEDPIDIDFLLTIIR